MLFRLCPPLAANPRMKDLLKRQFFGRVGEHYGAKLRSIQVACAGKHLRAKFAPDFFLNFRPIQKRMCRLVCIEECCDRLKLAKTFDECAFTRGNSAGNPNRRHDMDITGA
jgi:hypothetical protein